MNSIYILQNTSYYDVLFNSILNAKRSIYVSAFSYNLTENMDNLQLVRNITKLLIQKSQEGIDVKLIFGNSYKTSKIQAFQKLDMSNELAFTIFKSFGVQASFFSHYKQESSHSKYVLIDDELVFIGSHNFSPRAFGIGFDDSISILDERIGNQVKSIFLTDWKYSTLPPNSELVDFNNSNFIFPFFEKRDCEVPIIKDTITSNVLLNHKYFEVLINEIENSKASVFVSMFYFSYSKDTDSITSKILNAISKAFSKGVEVKIILDRDNPSDIYASSKANTKRYEELKKIGINVKFDKPETATHSKLVIIDNRKIIIGSHNWTYGSFNYYQDLSLMIESKSLSDTFTDIYNKRFNSLD